MRVTRFELVYPLWKSGVLPLNDTRVAKDAHYPEPARRGQASASGPGAGNQTQTGVTTMGKRGHATGRPVRHGHMIAGERRIRLRFTGSRLPSSCAHGSFLRFRRP